MRLQDCNARHSYVLGTILARDIDWSSARAGTVASGGVPSPRKPHQSRAELRRPAGPASAPAYPPSGT